MMGKEMGTWLSHENENYLENVKIPNVYFKDSDYVHML